MNHIQKDICILGGGLAAVTLALQLKKQDPLLDITLLEKRAEEAPEASFKVGESTVEIGAHYFYNILGLKDHIQDAQLPKFGLRYFFTKDDNIDISKRLECGANSFLPTPSFQLDRGIFENHLIDKCRNMGIDILLGSKIKDVTLPSPPQKGFVQVEHEHELISLQSDWIIDCTGRFSLIKRKLNLSEKVNHLCSAAWFRVKGAVKIDSWSNDSDWKKRMASPERWLSTNHFMGKGYWVWIIPLGSGNTSIGIVADQTLHPIDNYNSIDKAKAWLKKHEPQCFENIQNEVLDFLAYKNFSYGCKQVFSDQKWALSGEAGLFLDPFYSPGSDYIAISNTFICELIKLDRQGKSITAYSMLFDQIYHQLFQIHLTLYSQQYPIFGNGKVMPFKIIWDFSYYWCIPATFFFHQKITNPHLFSKFQKELIEVSELNEKVQSTFQDMAKKNKDSAPANFINLPEVSVMKKLNSELQDELNDEEFVERLNDNIQLLKNLAKELTLINQNEALPQGAYLKEVVDLTEVNIA